MVKAKKAGTWGVLPLLFLIALSSAVTGRLLMPSWPTTAGGGLEGNSPVGLSRARLAEARSRKFRKANFLDGLVAGFWG